MRNFLKLIGVWIGMILIIILFPILAWLYNYELTLERHQRR